MTNMEQTVTALVGTVLPKIVTKINGTQEAVASVREEMAEKIGAVHGAVVSVHEEVAAIRASIGAPGDGGSVPVEMEARINSMASLCEHLGRKVEHLEEEVAALAAKSPRKRNRVAKGLLEKVDAMTSADLATVNHALRLTGDVKSASRFGGVPLPVVKYLAGLDTNQWAQLVASKRTGEAEPPLPAGLCDDDLYIHWSLGRADTTPEATIEDTLTDEDSVEGEE